VLPNLSTINLVSAIFYHISLKTSDKKMKKLIIGFLVIIGLLNETEEALTSKICQKEGFFR